MHLPIGGPEGFTTTAGAALASLPALGTPLGFIGVTLIGEELLFSHGEDELVPALDTGKVFV
jgi:hypothetical protein